MPASSAERLSVFKLFGQHAKPVERPTLPDWSDLYRVLSSKSSAEPGRWRTSRTPYLREIMECLSPDSPVQRVWFMKGAQVGATEIGTNWLGYIIDVAPGPMLFVQPTLDMAKRAAQQRIDPMIEETPRLRERLPPKRSKDGGNSLFSKHFPGGVIQLAGANSATSLRSMPARYLFLDEVDAYPGDLDGEGDPVALADARARTFRNRKAFYVSTPTIAGVSRIERGYLATDQRKYHVPCPHCGEFQAIEWPRISWDHADLSVPAWLDCAHCGTAIEERGKGRMLARGEWRATAPDAASREVRGYHLSALYSPFGGYTWTDARDEFLKAQKDHVALKTWVNTCLGESWVEKGDAPPWRRLYARRGGYPQGTVPMGGSLLTAGVDVQKDRIEVEIRAWGSGHESWSVDFLIFEGDTATLEAAGSPWRQLDGLLARSWPHESGVELKIARLAVDSGYATQTVYAWARRQDQRRVAAIKGSDSAGTMIGLPTPVDVNYGGKIKRGLRLWSVGVSIAKSELYGWLRQDPPGEDEQPPTGWMHWPEYSEEYFLQLTAEEVVPRQQKNGYVKHEWVKRRERNEALDCAVYNRAAASIVGIDRWQEPHWLAHRRSVGIPDAPPPPSVTGGHGPALADISEALAPQAPPQAPAPRPKRHRRPSIWDGR